MPEGAGFVLPEGPGPAVAPSLDAAAVREGQGVGIQLYEREGCVVCVSAGRLGVSTVDCLKGLAVGEAEGQCLETWSLIYVGKYIASNLAQCRFRARDESL